MGMSCTIGEWGLWVRCMADVALQSHISARRSIRQAFDLHVCDAYITGMYDLHDVIIIFVAFACATGPRSFVVLTVSIDTMNNVNSMETT